MGYTPSQLIQLALPHSDPKRNEFTSINGHTRISLIGPSDTGLPYGTYPRLLLIWLTTQAALSGSSSISMGNSLASFMKGLGLRPTGGHNGTISRLRDQASRLFQSSVIIRQDGHLAGTSDRGMNLDVTDAWQLWPHASPSHANTVAKVELSSAFMREISSGPVPLDMNAVLALQRSPLALDIYTWATRRVYRLRSRTYITWPILHAQIGANYGTDRKGRHNFMLAVRAALVKVSTLYPQLRIHLTKEYIVLFPSPTHVSRRLQPDRCAPVHKPVG